MTIRTTKRRKKRRTAKRLPQAAGRTRDPEWQYAFAALKTSLRPKRATGYRVGTITEDDTYGNDP